MPIVRCGQFAVYTPVFLQANSTKGKGMIDRKAFDAAWETMGWDNQNPQATEAQERFVVAAYEAAKPEIVLGA